MYKNLQKIELNLQFKNKRNFKLITPCCLKTNKDGKFVNYIGVNQMFGYCHSCGITTLPPIQYLDENGNRFQWDELQSKFIPSDLQSSYIIDRQMSDEQHLKHKTRVDCVAKERNYIKIEVVNRYMKVQPQNNLLSYIFKTYGNEKKEFVTQLYKLGTSKDGGIIFWSINKQQKVQKAKVVYYTSEGKRTQKFKVPYKNEDGYYNCLFGEHLLGLPKYNHKPIILLESEKTAIISSINFPRYLWLSYGGINGLTEDKMRVLKGKSIIVIPDLSNNAVSVINKKLPLFLELDINAKIWDMTNGKTDDQLKEEGLYNCDLEDFLRKFIM